MSEIARPANNADGPVETMVFGRSVRVERDWRRTPRGPSRQEQRGGKRSHTVGPESLAVIAQLVDARHKAGMTQREVGEALGVEGCKVSDFENARHERGLGFVVRYAQAVGLDRIETRALSATEKRGIALANRAAGELAK